MKTSQATLQLKSIKKRHLFNLILILFISYALIILIGILYCFPIYMDVFWKNFFLNNLSSLYNNDIFIQTVIVVTLCSILFIIAIISSLIISYKSNTRYQNEYINIVYDELKLNEIYLVNKRRVDESADLEVVYKTLALKNIEREHLFTLKSFLEMDFYQFYSFTHRRKDNALLIKAKIEKGINGYLSLQFNTNYTIEEYNKKGIFQYNFQDTRKYSYDIYANTSLGKNVYEVVDENVLNTMIQLKNFTNANLIVTLTDNLFYVFIPGWELKLTDSLYKKLSFDTMDKKVECFTELIDEVTDLYVYLVNKEELWQKKW